MAWYRQYRPQQIKDLHIVPVREQLQSILDSGKFSHAYLFAGPKGTGKTSSARILARVLNEPQNQKTLQSKKGKFSEPVSDDPVLRKIAEGRSQVVIEQDAASHRGIDDIRQLQEHVSVVPTEGFVRVVILDEVHMLTNEAFNALLKLLEEPPENVVFVLATTELHKVPATVQSRCRLIRFRQATHEEIQAVLQSIADQEKISVEGDILSRLSKVANGSFRDAVKYFEQVVTNGKVDLSLAEVVLGTDEQITELLRSLATKDIASVSEYFSQARHSGASFKSLEQSLLGALQERLSRAIQRQEPKNTLMNIVDLLEHFSQRLGGPEPIEGMNLEVACLRWCVGASPVENVDSDTIPKADKPKSKSETLACAKEVVVREKFVEEVKPETPVVEEQQKKTVSQESVQNRAEIEQKWSSILLTIREQSTAVESILRNAQLGKFEGNTLHIIFNLSFHKERLETKKYSHIVLDVLRKRLGLSELEVVYDLVQLPDEEIVETASDQDDLLLLAVEEALLSME